MVSTFANLDSTLSAGRRWLIGRFCGRGLVGIGGCDRGVIGLGVVARGLLEEIAENAVRGREKLNSNPLNELSGLCQVAGPYLPFGRNSNLFWGRSSSFSCFNTD